MPTSTNRALLFSLLVTSAGGVLVSCSSPHEPPLGAAGSHAGSGSAGGASTLPPARGNVTLRVQPSNVTPPSCPVSGKTYVVGDPRGPSPNANTPGDRLIDGE